MPGEGAYKAIEGADLAAQASLSSPPAKRQKLSHLEAMGHTLWQMRESGDFTIQCGGAALRAHRCILEAASPTFAAMFSNQMLEVQTSVLKIEDADEIDVESFLHFMYTGELESSANDCAVLRIADKYGMDSLVAACCERIVEKLSVATVTDSVRALRRAEGNPMAEAFKIVSAKIGKDPKMRNAVLKEL